MRRLIPSVTIILVMLLVFSACVPLPSNGLEEITTQTTSISSETTTTQITTPEVFRLCYSSKESMHPFQLKGVANQMLMPLLYEPLFFVDENFEAQPILVENYTMDGLEIAVTIKDGIIFSNGSTLTTSDVFTSCKLAQKSELYQKKLENIEKITIESEVSMTFHLKEGDIHFINALDFPIIDGDTADNSHPAGCGRYRFLTNEDGALLTANENWIYEHSVGFDPIPLLDIPEGGAVVNSLETGNISFLFDELSEGSGKRINAATHNVPMNNLVFLSANPNRFDLSFRQGVSYALSRKDIVTNGFQGNAIAATGPFHPGWKQAKQYQTWEIITDSAKAADAFTKAQTSKKAFQLLINDENAFRKDTAAEIKKQLAAFGIDVEIVSKRWEDYILALQNGSYDFFLGEIRISSNMDLTPLLSGGTKEEPTGIFSSAQLKEDYASYRAGALRMDDFLSSFDQTMPFIPLCYRNGVVAYTRSLIGEMHPSQSNVFVGMETWRL